MIEFAGRTAFVTGGANGVGIGLVRALLAEGCRVAIADINEKMERVQATLDRLADVVLVAPAPPANDQDPLRTSA